MADFPKFMKSGPNRIASSSQHSAGVEGYVFDGVDGSQMAFWQTARDGATAEHVHPFDEWLVVLEGTYLLSLDGKEIRLGAGSECHIPAGTRISGSYAAGTRTVHAFGGPRARRA
jgi:quercetin dioxygenase-like cupin family protein